MKKADECYAGMHSAFSTEDWNMAVIAAVHCGISSADALTVKHLGLRNSGSRHESVIKLLSRIDLPDTGKKTQQLSNLLRIKSTAEYEEKLMSKSDASDALRDAERFYKWIKGVLGE